MKQKQTLLLLSVTVLTFLVLSSCEEKTGESEYNDWENRNKTFIDSIAKVASTNADGSWRIIKAYTLGDSTAIYTGQTNRFIYARILRDSKSVQKPLYGDSVRVHYYGRLIPSKTYPLGYNFDKSYIGDTLASKTDVPALLSVANTVVGFSTALQNMAVGDRWLVYIPHELGYGTVERTSIPAYSSLIFEMELAKIYRKGIDTNTSWH